MGYFSAFAIYFVLWWLVLFAMLPFNMRTQDEDGDVTLGTVASAPRGAHMRRAFLRTTVATAILFAGLYYLNQVAGYTFDDLPHLVPEFG